MKTIMEIKAKRSFACPGLYGYDAEATVYDSDTGKDVYVHVNSYDSMRNYTVSETSIYDFMTGDGEHPEAEFSEEYERLSDAKKSEYGKVFDVLAKVVTRMESGID